METYTYELLLPDGRSYLRFEGTAEDVVRIQSKGRGDATDVARVAARPCGPVTSCACGWRWVRGEPEPITVYRYRRIIDADASE